jgi:Pyridoxamine 5'-phosphate oxidase
VIPFHVPEATVAQPISRAKRALPGRRLDQPGDLAVSLSTDSKERKVVDPQEMTEELEHPGARNLLASATLLRLAYDGSDGFPRVVPIGFYFNGNQIVVCTAATAPKVKALSSRPNVAITIDVGDTPTEAKALLVRGLASVDIVDGVPDEYLAASRKVLGADQMPVFERQVRSMYDQMARISIEPVWARFFDFGAGRMPSFLMKLAGDA